MMCAAHAGDGVTKCANCGRSIGAAAHRCLYCGAVKGRKCPKCKAILPSGAEICYLCKTDIPSSIPNFVLDTPNAETTDSQVTPNDDGETSNQTTAGRQKTGNKFKITAVLSILLVLSVLFLWKLSNDQKQKAEAERIAKQKNEQVQQENRLKQEQEARRLQQEAEKKRHDDEARKADNEKKSSEAAKAWADTKAKVQLFLTDAKNNLLSYEKRCGAADSALELLSSISSSSSMSYLSIADISEIAKLKSEISNLKSEIASLKSKLVQIPVGFEMLKEPAADTSGLPQEIKHKATGIELVYVAPGEFMMGSPPNEVNRENNETQHQVTLTKPYYIGKYEVTQGQWESVMGNIPSSFNASGKDAPVELISWNECQVFIKKLNEGVSPSASALRQAQDVGNRFRLPTEAEWEYAARGGNRGKGYIYSGSNNLDEVGWYDKNSGYKTHRGGQKNLNELGIYDMSGNVWEWCSDWYGDYPTGSFTDPMGGSTGSIRVLRGGAWSSNGRGCNVASRDGREPYFNHYDLGFRLAMDIPSAEGKQNTVASVPLSAPVNNSKPETTIENQQLSLGPASGNDWKIPDIGMEFVWIKALDCWVGKYEVTNGEYRKFKSEHNSKDFQGNPLNGYRQPVIYVNFDDANVYAKWLTDRERKAGRIPAGYIYRLPSEKEWTTFCQCGDSREYPWGNGMPPKYGNYADESSKSFVPAAIPGYNDGFPVTCPVEKSGKNDWGLYGVGGNVWELTVKSSADLSFSSARGAAWWHGISNILRSSEKIGVNPSYRNATDGFRLVLSR
ncbi:MAG: SUMF1/EgtB/PvdO family nonheme iron enzyme [Lentisphaerae bacterium]|nr:SUMF1/EgtB/PvdO family nonheme iron enzyme [Lentisphaerota bacterium]